MSESSADGRNPLTEKLLSNAEDESEAGDPVPVPHTEQSEREDTEDPESRSWDRGEKQPSQWRDLPFGILFHTQCIAVTILAVIYGIPTVKENFQTDEIEVTGAEPLYPVLVAIVSSTVFMILNLAIVVRKAKLFISGSIIFNILVQLTLGVATIANGSNIGGAILVFFGIMGCCYYCAIKRRIPFAAANLHAGAKAVRDNGGIVALAYCWGALFIVWLSLWSVYLYSTVLNGSVNTCNDYDSCDLVMTPSTKVYIVLLVLSFYWTLQVSNNVLHTSVAGVVGTWYFDPSDASQFFSGAVWASTVRTLTYSFGSVCFGSLLCAVISTLRFILNTRSADNGSRGESMLLCVLDCILSLLENIVEYFNKWAFIYVGLYGYPYITAGKKVTHLFQQRGWTVIINDGLVSRALNLTSFTVGLLCGTVQYLVFSDKGLFAFGFVFGVFFSFTMMSVVDSAVSTIMVCFAEAPEELERNHPDHSLAMKEAWYSVHQVRC